MTVYSDMMAKRLEANRNAVDDLYKARHLVGTLAQLADEVRKLGASANFSNGTLDIVGEHGKNAKKVSMKDIKILLDEYLFSDDRFEVDDRHTESWIFVHITDKNTGGRWSVDIGMERLECKRVEVSRKMVEREEIQYRYECE